VGLSYKDWFTRHCNFEHVSVDVNGLNGALALDLRQPLTPLEGRVFDMVTNIGTGEHVESDQHCVWKNIWDHLAVGGHLVSITPLAGDWHWHGLWYPTEEFYDAFAYRNDMAVVELGEYGAPPRRCQFPGGAQTAGARVRLSRRRPALPQCDSKARVTVRFA
jgi:SAM-dependent methyltransferase